MWDVPSDIETSNEYIKGSYSDTDFPPDQHCKTINVWPLISDTNSSGNEDLGDTDL